MANKIGRIIFYEKTSGTIIFDTEEKVGHIERMPPEYYIRTIKKLSEIIESELGFIELEYGQYGEDFATCNGYRVNPDTMKLEFSYPDPGEPEMPPVYQKPLSEELEDLKQENTLLKAQNQALTERADFIEDVVAEMAVQVYQ